MKTEEKIIEEVLEGYIPAKYVKKEIENYIKLALSKQKQEFRDAVEDRFQQIRVDLQKDRLTILQLAEREKEILKVLEEK